MVSLSLFISEKMRWTNKISRFVLGCILLFFVQCSIKSADIRKGEYLERAKETTVEDFFQKRMKNKIKKVMGANWEILFESSEFIYFGYPLISFFREETFVEELFKVNRNQLESEFPTYKRYDGIEMKIICNATMVGYKKSSPKQNFVSIECSSNLERDYILMNATLNYKIGDNQNQKEKYLIQFDKKNLTKLSIVNLGDESKL